MTRVAASSDPGRAGSVNPPVKASGAYQRPGKGNKGVDTPRSPNKNRPKRVLLMALGLFLMVQLGFGLWLDHVAPLFRFTSLRAILVRLQQCASQPETLVLGSSRLEGAFVEIEAARIGQVGLFNAAVPAGDPTAQEAVLNRLIASGIRPRRVWLEVSPEFFARTNFCAGWNGLRLHRWMDLPAHLDQIACTNQLGRVAASRFVPVYQYRDLIWQEFARNANRRADNPSSSQPTKASGACQRPGKGEQGVSTPRLIHLGKTEALTHPAPLTPQQVAVLTEGGRYAARAWLRDYRVDPLNVHALHRVLARCRELDAEVWLITAPVSSPHRAAYTPEIEAAYQELLAATGCRHIDCRDWMADGWFNDSHHLNAEGGIAFTRRFLREYPSNR